MKSKLFIPLFLFLSFLLSGLVATYFSFQNVSPESITRKITSKLLFELQKIEHEANSIIEGSRESEMNLPPVTHGSFFVFNRGELVSWNDNRFVPTLQDVESNFTLKLLKTSNGDYVIRKWKIDSDGFLLAVLPLYTGFKIQNNYLQPQWNKEIFPQGNVRILEPGSSSGFPITIRGNSIFKITTPTDTYLLHERNRLTAAVLLFLSICCLVFLIYKTLPNVKNRGKAYGFLFLVVALFGIRILMVVFDFPSSLIHTRIFDPKYFASSNYNSSLGDLILNELVILALCYYLFNNRASLQIYLKESSSFVSNTAKTVFSILCFLFAGLYPFVVIQTLYNNSSIPLDIAQSLHFDLLRIVSFVAIMISWACSFLFSHVFIENLFTTKKWIQSLICAILGIIIFVAINLYSHQTYWSSLFTSLVYFGLVYTLRLYRSFDKIGYTTFAYLFAFISFTSLNGAFCIKYFGEKEKTENQFRFATNFLIDKDNFGEYLLHETSLKIQRDGFVKLRMSSPFFSKDAVRQKIRQFFLPSYFNKYDVDILLYNSDGTPYNNHLTSSFTELINTYNQEAFQTEYKEVHFINSPSADVTQKYLVIVPINRRNAISGYVVIELSLKKIIPDNVYPELLVDNRFRQFYKTEDLSYAVFSNKEIVFSSGDFNYEGLFNRSWLGKGDLYNTGIKESGYIHIAQEDEIGRAAVVSSKLPSFSFIVSNFSFLLVSGLLIILLLFVALGIINYFRGEKLVFAARIQLFLNLAFFFPLIVASVTTLGLTSQSSKRQLDEEYLNKTEVFGDQISVYLDAFMKYYNENQPDFENQLTNLAKLTNLDANVYTVQGKLMSTSQPQIFENSLLSTYINPAAIEKIKNGETLFIEQEQVGLLKYFVSYAALKSAQSGKLIGILAIPFFQSAYSLEKVQITIFTNILNIFAAIFIVLLLLSYLVSEWLTFPLRFITQSLSKTSLTEINQPLKWNASDEIGLMAREYNKMLFKLSESKAELEQTQRERAWREMAQQVAHEIKNPLTPMKLTLQQLERSIQNGSNSTEKTEKALNSLLIQVDTLNDIASSFSSFAKMPEPVVQRLELIGLLRRIVDLHNQGNKLHFKPQIKELFVLGDEQLLGRTFSNIILNATQALRSGVPIHVIISIEVDNNACLIKFADNGTGIDKDHESKVFVPHFSTKKSGSGLGLAIAKQAIEQMNGKIWFETQINKGTTFNIELQLAN
ncbi:MAG TPA: HAMP domain-containing sensor histidine kinase [Cyclobacteriaceae bacterium]|nr:HAMP domain-containing sensor histidine kinase [Cyclobacteriaceae bacterium]